MHRKNQNRRPSFAGNPVFFKDLINGLPARVKRALSEILRESVVKAGTVVIERGEPAADFFVLRSGDALLMVDTGNGTCVTRNIATGEMLGVPESASGIVYDTTVVARSDCRFESAAGTELAGILQLHPSLCFRLVTLLGSNLNKGRQIFASTTI